MSIQSRLQPNLYINCIMLLLAFALCRYSYGESEYTNLNDTTTAQSDFRNQIEQLNKIKIGKDIEIILPEMPADLNTRTEFLNLSLDEQKSFYVKRRFIVEKLTSGLTRPGLKGGIRWAKNKFYTVKSLFSKKDSAAESMTNNEDNDSYLESKNPLVDSIESNQDEYTQVDESTLLKWQKLPVNLSDEAKKFVETTVTGLLDNLWKNSIDIAKSNGLGMTYVGGMIFNTSLGKKGYVWGRSLSIDLGVNFTTGEGYIKFLYDKQALKNGGLSFDVGLMFDILFHVTNADLEEGDVIKATHVKLPIIGCFRSGEGYKAWGLQVGVSVVEMVGGWLSFRGFPILGSSLITGTRVIGAATTYSTNLSRNIIKTMTVPKSVLKYTGLSKLLDLSKNLNPDKIDNKLTCEGLFL